jgi:hypothetical protein
MLDRTHWPGAVAYVPRSAAIDRNSRRDGGTGLGWEKRPRRVASPGVLTKIQRVVTRSAGHYAANWKTEGVIKPLCEINELGARYVATRDPELLLEICQCFHPYLMKYLVMICRGHVPIVGIGKQKARINKEVKNFVKYFLPRGEKLNSTGIRKVIKHFHLAFKGMETDEVYDVLMEQLIAAVDKYDPTYKDNVKQVVGVINRELSKSSKILVIDANRHLEFDRDRYVRVLAGHGLHPLVLDWT